MARTMKFMSRYVPPEWAEQAALWVGWPHLRDEWGDAFDGAREEIAGFVAAAARYVPVRVACGSDEAAASAQAVLGDIAELVRVPTGDIWLRDTGPIIARVDEQPKALTFEFNGWGGTFEMPGDTETAAAIAAAEGLDEIAHDFVLEGGAVDLDGDGRLLTTRQCMLNPNRNPGWTQAQAEVALKTAFGVEQVIWLGDGLANDHTDGHVDNIARFTGPGHVICQRASGANDPNAQTYAEVEADLRAAGLRVSVIASPGLIGEAQPASHMNFAVTNGAVLLPTYESEHSQAALEALALLFPGREIIARPANHILMGGGSFHCMTREVPRFEAGAGA